MLVSCISLNPAYVARPGDAPVNPHYIRSRSLKVYNTIHTLALYSGGFRATHCISQTEQAFDPTFRCYHRSWAVTYVEHQMWEILSAMTGLKSPRPSCRDLAAHVPPSPRISQLGVYSQSIGVFSAAHNTAAGFPGLPPRCADFLCPFLASAIGQSTS